MKWQIFSIALALVFSPYPTKAGDAKSQAKLLEQKTRYGEISYPVLSGLPDKNIENSINAIIKEEASSWNCDFDGERESVEGLDYNTWSEVKLIDTQHFSYTASSDYFCGGAHPNQQQDTHNYDLTTGTPVPINALLVPQMLDEHLTAFLLKEATFEREGCRDAYTDINWDYYRTAKDIVFIPRLPGRNNVCVQEFPVPVEDLKSYMWSEIEEDRD